MIRHFAAALLMASVGTQAIAAEAAPQCIKAEDAAAAAVAFTPALIDAVASKCAPSLPSAAFLNTGVKDLTARFRSAVPDRNAVLGKVMESFFGKDMPPEAKGEAMVAFMEAMAVGKAAQAIEVRDCPYLNTIIEAGAPMPPENMAVMITAAINLAILHTPATDKKMPFCRGPVAAPPAPAKPGK